MRAGFAFGFWIKPVIAYTFTRIKGFAVGVARHSIRERAGWSSKSINAVGAGARVEDIATVGAFDSIRELAVWSSKSTLARALAGATDRSLAVGAISSVRVLAVLSGMSILAVFACAIGLDLPETSARCSVAVLTLKSSVLVRCGSTFDARWTGAVHDALACRAADACGAVGAGAVGVGGAEVVAGE